MKKIFLFLPIVALLAAGCNQAEQTSTQSPAPAPVVQNTNTTPPATPITPTQTPTSTTTLIEISQRDNQRVSDVARMQGELEVYFYDNNQYPNTLNDLLSDKAIALEAGSPSSKIPTAPVPPDGSCTEQQNTYQYTKTSATTFNLTFCLGMANNWYSLSAGFHTATQNHGVK